MLSQGLIQAEDGIPPVPVLAGDERMPGFRTHVTTLLCKNWELKKQQWWAACCCFKGWCPCALFCEVVFPVLICCPLVFAKYKCGDTCVNVRTFAPGFGCFSCRANQPAPWPPQNYV